MFAALLATTTSALSAETSAAAEPLPSLPARLNLPAQSVSNGSGDRGIDGFFIDAKGQRRSFAAVYRPWFGEFSREPHYARATAEMAILLTVGLGHYWAMPGINRNDWDVPALTQRLNFQAVRFDNNRSVTNFVSHPFAGAAYYGFGRINELSVPEAAMYSIITSGLWEYVLEWREQVSINDMIFTPAGGLAVGSFLYQLTEYLGSAPDGGSAGNKAASYTLGFARHVHPRDENPNAGSARLPPDSLGFSSAFWHTFRLGYDASFVRAAGSEAELLHTVVADGWLVSMPGFLRPGRFGKLFVNDAFSELHVRLGFAREGFEDTDLRAKATVVGYYRQDFARGRHGVFGHGELLGYGPGLRYVERYYGGDHDMYASTHLFNLEGGVWFGLGPLRGHLEAEARYDFAAARALALAEYQEVYGDASLKSVLTVQGYQFGVGPAQRVQGDLSLSTFSLGGYADHSFYRMVGGVDRAQATMSGDVSGEDQIVEYGTWVQQKAPLLPVYVRAFADWISRKSVLGRFEVRRTDERYGLGAGLVF